MAKTTVKHDNLVKRIDNDVGITLTAGTAYTQGMVVTSIDGVNFTNGDVLLSTAADYNKQEILVLADDYDATAGALAGIGYTGEFNENNVTLPGVQTKVALAGVLQAKNIILKDWSK